MLQLISFWQHFKNQLNQRYWKISSWYKLPLHPCRSLKVSSCWSFGMTKMPRRTRAQSSRSFKKLVLATVEQMSEEQHNNLPPWTQTILGLLSWARTLRPLKLNKLNLKGLLDPNRWLQQTLMKERLQMISTNRSGQVRIKEASAVQLVLLLHHRMINKSFRN